MRLVADDEGSAIYGVKIPPGYRGWEMVGVAHEAGNLNDIRAIFGSSVTIKAFRGGTRRFLDDTIIARLAWQDVPSDENNAVFGRFQSFVPGPAANVQFMVKDIKIHQHRRLRFGQWSIRRRRAHARRGGTKNVLPLPEGEGLRQ